MIRVNGNNFEWFKGITIDYILKEKNYTFPNIIVKINGKTIRKSEYDTAIINDGDDIKILHVFAGG